MPQRWGWTLSPSTFLKAELHKGFLVGRLGCLCRFRNSFCFTLCKFPAWTSLFILLTAMYCQLCQVSGAELVSRDRECLSYQYELWFHYLHPCLRPSCSMRVLGVILWHFDPHPPPVTSCAWSHQLFPVFSKSLTSFSFPFLWTCLNLPYQKKIIKKILKLLPQLDVPFTDIIFLSQKVIIKTPAMCQVKIMQNTGDKRWMKHIPRSPS